MRINHPRRSGFYRQAGPVILSRPCQPSRAATRLHREIRRLTTRLVRTRRQWSPWRGREKGGVSVTPKLIPEGYFAADIKVRVRNARSNATYLVQRAPEIGRTASSNGVCERALGMAPWSST